MEPSEVGGWVAYEDHQDEIEGLLKRLEMMEEEVSNLERALEESE
jgi:hypothetical protein